MNERVGPSFSGFAVLAAIGFLLLLLTSPASAQSEPGGYENDALANAELIVELPFEADVDLSSATFEESESSCLSSSNRASRWYRWTAPEDDVLLRTPDHTRVYTSAEPDPGITDLQPTSCFVNEVNVRAGETYWIQISGTPGDVQQAWLARIATTTRSVDVTLVADPSALPPRYTVLVTSSDPTCSTAEVVTETVTGNDVVTVDDLLIFSAGPRTYCRYQITAEAGDRWSVSSLNRTIAGVAQNPLRLDVKGRPWNDDPSGAEPIELPVELRPPIAEATPSAENLACGAARTMWYTLDAVGDFRVASEGSAVGVYLSSTRSADDLVAVACVDGYDDRVVIVDAEGGQQFYIALSDDSSYGGATIESAVNDGTITVDVEAASDVEALPESIDIRLISDNCSVDLLRPVDAVTGLDRVQFTDLRRYDEQTDACEYWALADSPSGWSRPSERIIDLDTSYTLGYRAAAVNNRLDSALLLEGRILQLQFDEEVATDFRPDELICGRRVPALWYRWVAPSDGVATLNSDGDFAAATSAVTNPSSLADLNDVTCSDGFYVEERETLDVIGGETYWIAILDSRASNNATRFALRHVPTGCNGATAQAMDGLLSGEFELNADGYVATPNAPSVAADYVFDASSDDFVEVCLQIRRAGSYYLWADMQAPDGDSDSFWITVNDGPAMPLFARAGYLREANAARALQLESGAHLIRLYRREAGAAVDDIELRFVRSAQIPGATLGCASVNQIVEAESANLSGSFLAQKSDQNVPTPSGSGYVGVPAWVPNQYAFDAGSAAQFCFTNRFGSSPNDRFTIVATVLGTENEADSFWVQVGDDEPFVWHLDGSQSWTTQVVRQPGRIRPYIFPGTSDEIIVRFFARESGTLLDSVQLNKLTSDYQSYPSAPHN